MNDSFPIEPQLFDVYRAVFEMLLRCLLVSVALLLAGTIVLIVLCCRETKLDALRRKSGLSAPRSKESGNESSCLPDVRQIENQAGPFRFRGQSRRAI